jgi:hypothetical protein
MPVFVTWSTSAFRPSLTRSRSWLTSSGVAFHPTAPPCGEPDRSTRLRRPKARRSFDPSGLSMKIPIPKNCNLPAKAVRCSAALLGETALESRFAHRNPVRDPRSRVAQEAISSSGALFPTGPGMSRSSSHCLPAEIGSSVPSSPFAPSPALQGDWDFRPDHRSHHAPPPRVAEAKNMGSRLWITGISGTSAGTFFDCPSRACPLPRPSV